MVGVVSAPRLSNTATMKSSPLMTAHCTGVPPVQLDLAAATGAGPGQELHQVVVPHVDGVVQRGLAAPPLRGVHVGALVAEEPDDLVVAAEGGEVEAVLPL